MPDILAGFILTFIITSLINQTTSYLDIHYPWSGNLKVKIIGSGSVYYRQTPVITAEITGSGVVRPG